MTPKRMAALFVIFVILVTVIAVGASGCGKNKRVNHGIILDKSHYPEQVIDGKKYRERCTLTIDDDESDLVEEVEIPCDSLDQFAKGMWWLRLGQLSPSPREAK